MPIHFEDVDVVSQVSGFSSALIVPCNMCPAATVAIREEKPFMKIFSNFLKSAPFENYMRTLRFRLKENGVDTEVFNNYMPHQWFMCMWTTARRKKLQKYAQQYEAVIVLGCESATETVRGAVKSNGCKVIEGMEVTGIMNTELQFQFPGNIMFENCKIVPISKRKNEDGMSA